MGFVMGFLHGFGEGVFLKIAVKNHGKIFYENKVKQVQNANLWTETQTLCLKIAQIQDIF